MTGGAPVEDALALASEPSVREDLPPPGVYPLLPNELWVLPDSTVRPGTAREPGRNGPLLLALMCVRRAIVTDPVGLSQPVLFKLARSMRRLPTAELTYLADVLLHTSNLAGYGQYALKCATMQQDQLGRQEQRKAIERSGSSPEWEPFEAITSEAFAEAIEEILEGASASSTGTP
jgi:hypothetical protein